MSRPEIIVVGGDLDALMELSETPLGIRGYTSDLPRPISAFPHVGTIKNYLSNSENVRLIVTTDDILLRSWILENYAHLLHTYISPTARVSRDAVLGMGSFVQANAFVSAGARVGRCTKINVGVQVHHESSIGDCSVLAPASVLLGRTKVGDRSYVGASSCVREKIEVGHNCFIGMGSVVVSNVESATVMFGNPARVKDKKLLNFTAPSS